LPEFELVLPFEEPGAALPPLSVLAFEHPTDAARTAAHNSDARLDRFIVASTPDTPNTDPYAV
jgi:hypothetical protein